MTDDREIKPSEGKCWKNAEKTESWHGDYKGTFVMPDGTKHFLDLYVNKMADGQAWFKIKVGKAKAATPAAAAPVAPVAAKVALLDEDIPF
jgi:hypothetical protein